MVNMRKEKIERMMSTIRNKSTTSYKSTRLVQYIFYVDIEP